MLHTVALPLCKSVIKEYGNISSLQNNLHSHGFDGIEGIWAGEDIPVDLAPGMVPGYHIRFFPDWLDFFREDRNRVAKKFGSWEKAKAFYGGAPDILLTACRADIKNAAALGSRYAVFHVSDISIEESYTYHWQHSNAEIIDGALELIRGFASLLPPNMTLLVENQWWPGFTFTEPRETERLLDAIPCKKKGIMLDTGHLMNCNLSLRTQGEGLHFIRQQLLRHGELCREIKGIHLHQSLSGAYVSRHTELLPKDMPQDYTKRFIFNYPHILQIDRHLPWSIPEISCLIEELHPQFVTHEMNGDSAEKRILAAVGQRALLKQYGL